MLMSVRVLRLYGYDSECVYLSVSVLIEFYHVCLGMHVCIYICVCEGAGVLVLFNVLMRVCWHLYCVCFSW